MEIPVTIVITSILNYLIFTVFFREMIMVASKKAAIELAREEYEKTKKSLR